MAAGRAMLIWSDLLTAELFGVLLNELGCEVENPATYDEARRTLSEYRDWRLAILHSTASDGFTRDVAEDFSHRFPAIPIIVVPGDMINEFWFMRQAGRYEVFPKTEAGINACIDRIEALFEA